MDWCDGVGPRRRAAPTAGAYRTVGVAWPTQRSPKRGLPGCAVARHCCKEAIPVATGRAWTHTSRSVDWCDGQGQLAMDMPKPSCAHTRRPDVVCWRGYGAAMAPPRNAASTVRVLDGVGCMV